ncbi:FecR family protein [Sphingobacterium corticis]|uniref:FecR family protein n=1 Tax=Sphingobacterium corticis TaxID=1812823 RepID=A0ABW5NMW8_9SPHI
MRQEIKNTLRLFWEGKLNRSQAKHLLNDLDSQNDELRHELEIESTQEEKNMLSRDQSWQILQAIQKQTAATKSSSKTRRISWLFRAAAILIIFGVSSLLYPYFFEKETNEIGHIITNSHRNLHYVMANKDSVTHLLADGSIVELSPNSSICFDDDYGVNNRNIELKGKAKFQVQRDSTKAFIVTANGFTTTALGTTFIIDGKKSANTSIHLLSGKVVVRATITAKLQIKDTYLTLGQCLSINENTRLAHISTKNQNTSYIANVSENTKTRGHVPSQILAFNKLPLRDVMDALENHFDTTIEVSNDVPSVLTFTGTFSEHDKLSKILETICLVNDLNYIIAKDGMITILQNESIK